MMILTDAFVQVNVSSIRTNQARCALYRNFLDLLDEEIVSGESSDRAVLKIRREDSECLKSESIAKVRFKFILVHKHIYKTYYTGQRVIWWDISRLATVLSRAEGEWKYKVRVKWLHISQWPSVINCLLHTVLAQLNATKSSIEYFNRFNHFNDGSYDYVIQKAVTKTIRMLSV